MSYINNPNLNLSGTPFISVCNLTNTQNCVPYFHEQFPRKLFFFEVEKCRYFHIVSTIPLLLCSKYCGNYLRAETIQGWKLFAEIRYTKIHLQKKIHLYTEIQVQTDLQIPRTSYVKEPRCTILLHLILITEMATRGQISSPVELSLNSNNNNISLQKIHNKISLLVCILYFIHHGKQFRTRRALE